MELSTFVMFIERGENYKRINKALVIRHVENIRNLDNEGRLVVCGTTKGFPGVAGMIVFQAKDEKEAKAFCRSEPLVIEGYATYRLVTLRVGNKENNYLL